MPSNPLMHATLDVLKSTSPNFGTNRPERLQTLDLKMQSCLKTKARYSTFEALVLNLPIAQKLVF